MKKLTATVLAFGLAATTGAASAQTYSAPYGGNSAHGDHYDWARVVRVQPVYDSRGYAASTGGERCVESRTYAGDYRDPRGGYYGDSYGRDPYARDGYARDGYYGDRYDDRYRRDAGYGYGGSQVGGTVATVIGGIVGAAVGSQVGGGSARYATSAIGSMVGSMAGRQIYEQNRRARQQPRVGVAVACDPVPVGSYGNASGTTYDVTYEYAGRSYTTRTSYHPGERIRVRVDVRPE
jgi:uncharacterized protein YcfJ